MFDEYKVDVIPKGDVIQLTDIASASLGCLALL